MYNTIYNTQLAIAYTNSRITTRSNILTSVLSDLSGTRNIFDSIIPCFYYELGLLCHIIIVVLH